MIDPELRFQIRAYDAADNCIYLGDDALSCYYRKQCNAQGLGVITVPDNSDLLSYVADDLLIEIWLGYPEVSPGPTGLGLDWAGDFLGIYRDRQTATDEYGNLYHLLYCPSTIEILSRYTIAYPAGVDDRTKFTGREYATIANDLVQFNATEQATTAFGRLRNATRIRNLTDDGSIPGTPMVNKEVSNRNLLEAMQEFADICGFDFDVYRHPGEPGILHYHQYAGQLGTDRSASLFFDLALDNLSGANFNGDRLREKTVAIVGGEGEGTGRAFSIRTGPNYAASNDYEVFVDSRDSDAAELPAQGDEKLAEYRAKSEITTKIAASYGYCYKRDYGLGDFVTVRFGGASARRKIDAVEVTFKQEQRADIRLELADL